MELNSQQQVQQPQTPQPQSPSPNGNKKERDPFLPFLIIPLVLILLAAAGAGLRDMYLKHQITHPPQEKVEPSIAGAAYCLSKCTPYKLGWFSVSEIGKSVCYCLYDKESFPKVSK